MYMHLLLSSETGGKFLTNGSYMYILIILVKDIGQASNLLKLTIL